MKNQMYFYKDAGSNFIVVHQTLDDGKMLRYACGVGEHGLDLECRDGHDVDEIREELTACAKTLDFSQWTVFENEEEEMELTHFETCMGAVEKAYNFVIEWS